MKYRKTNIIFFSICGSMLPQIIKNNETISNGLILQILKSSYLGLQEKFGTNLKRLREEKNLSLRALASKCDLDDSQISKIENAKWDIQLSTIFELAKGLEIEPKDLLDFKI